MVKRPLAVLQIFTLLVLTSSLAMAQHGRSARSDSESDQIVPAADHHQHLFSPAYAKLQSPGFKTVSAQDVIEMLDKAEIKRAVLLSTAYRWGRPGAEPPDEYAGVKAENDHTAAQAALYPKRLIAFCGF